MSARDGLIGRLVIFGLSEQAASRVVDAYAHELAEKIRKRAKERYDRDYSDNRIFRLQGERLAADLIDPDTP